MHGENLPSAAASLFVLKSSDSVLSFVLQVGDQGRGRPTAIAATTFLHPEERRQISHWLEDLFECLAGQGPDPRRFEVLGRTLYQVLLPAPIRLQLRGLDGALTILTDDPSLPWELLRDDQGFLALRLPFARQLIIQNQMRGFLSPPERAKEEFRALVIADPTEDLPGAGAEGRDLAEYFRQHGECDFLAGEDASFEGISGHLVQRPYSVIHYCGHIDYDPKERTSSMRLARGGILLADRVMSVFRGSPVVFLNACYSDLRLPGDGTAQRRALGERIENFAQAFMMGNENGSASAVIGTMWRVPDGSQDAPSLPRVFYGALLEGVSLGEALRLARRGAEGAKWGPILWGPYVLYGEPGHAPFLAADQQHSRPDAAPAPPSELHHRRVGGTGEKVEIELSNPMTTEARQVLHVAQREMHKLEHRALTSMHLLIGFCSVGVEPLRAVLREREIAEEQLCQRLRHRARLLVPTEQEGFGISQGTYVTLANAAERVQGRRGDKLTAQDLLAGMLAWREAQAVQILAEAGVSPELLLERLPHSPVLSWSQWRFDSPTQEALELAESAARWAGLPFLGTPHLLIGLVRSGQLATNELLRQHGVLLAPLTAQLEAGVGRRPRTAAEATPLPLWLTKRCQKTLEHAAELAAAAGREELAEADLLVAVLAEGEGLTANVLRELGAEPAELLRSLTPAIEPTAVPATEPPEA